MTFWMGNKAADGYDRAESARGWEEVSRQQAAPLLGMVKSAPAQQGGIENSVKPRMEETQIVRTGRSSSLLFFGVWSLFFTGQEYTQNCSSSQSC